MTSFEYLDKAQKIRASIHRDVQSLCTEACHFLGLDITKPAVDLILDVFFHKMTSYADDLEKFAKHAKRSMITSDDCRLLTRRNSALTARINAIKPPGSITKESAKRRRTTASTASSPKRARIVENTTRPAENVTRAPENVTRAPENVTRAPENVTLASENVTRASENAAQTSENTRTNDDPNDFDIDAIDLTFD